MSIKDIFNRNNILIKGSVAEYQEYNQGDGIGDSGISIYNDVSKLLPTGIKSINYINPKTKEILNNGGSSPNKTPASSGATSPTDGKIWAIDIAQSHHFTVQIRDAGEKKTSGNLVSYKVSSSPFGDFLPVKTMNLTYSGYETMVLPFSAFSDFPLLQRRRVEVINLVCYDEDTSELENNLVVWNNECFPQGKYVAYMDNVVKELVYRGFTVDGRESLNIRRYVIPIGQIQVNRDYEENGAKLINFSLACVGDGSTCATGATTFREEPTSMNNDGATITPIKSVQITGKTNPSDIPREDVIYLDNQGNLSRTQTWDSSREEEAVRSVSSGFWGWLLGD